MVKNKVFVKLESGFLSIYLKFSNNNDYGLIIIENNIFQRIKMY